MQKFDFRMARVLRLREATVAAEEQILERARARRAELETELERLKKSATDAGREAKSSSWVRAAELASLSDYLGRIEREVKAGTAQLDAQLEAIRRQEAILIEARRRVRLLEMLRDRRRAEWQSEADRETAQLTEDFIAAQSVRRRRDAG